MQNTDAALVAVTERVSFVTRVRRYIGSAILSVSFVIAGAGAASATADPNAELGTVVGDFRSEITSIFLTYVLPAVFILGALTVGAALAWKWMRRAAKSS